MSEQFGYKNDKSNDYSNNPGGNYNTSAANQYNNTLDLNGDLVFSNSYSSLGGGSSGISNVEQAIYRSQVPIDINEPEEITVNGQRGVWANKAESLNWKGQLPISQYSVNEDSHPEIITKRSNQQLTYQQEIAIRYLRPPTPTSPGEIIVHQENNQITQPAPPLIIRQQPARPVTPQPLVIREAPPQPPNPVDRKIIKIAGKLLPPPPRKVVIERLAPLSAKPQSVIIERWLPYSKLKRRVIFHKSTEPDPVPVKPKNVIIQWEAPQIQVKKEFKDLGVIRANPSEYAQRYRHTLKPSKDLPSFVLEIEPPKGVVLASNYQQNHLYELEGDVHALKLIDLEKEGLSEYREMLQRMDDQRVEANSSVYSQQSVDKQSVDFISQMFALVDRDNDGRISVEEAEKILLSLNSRLGRCYGSNDVQNFFKRLNTNRDGFIDIKEFQIAFQKSL